MDTIEPRTVGLLSCLPSRLHHHAFVVRDHETNRRLLRGSARDPAGRDVVREELQQRAQQGDRVLPHLLRAWRMAARSPSSNSPTRRWGSSPGPSGRAKIGRYDHIAFKAEPETYDELKRRLERAGEPYRESNHGYCKSIYVSSPDGTVVEFTEDPPDVAEIDAVRRADAHQELARWMAGDRRTNNELRGRAFSAKPPSHFPVGREETGKRRLLHRSRTESGPVRHWFSMRLPAYSLSDRTGEQNRPNRELNGALQRNTWERAGIRSPLAH